MRDVIHTHVPRWYCPVCAGTGRLGQHRWSVTASGRVVRPPPEPCPRCHGTGRAGKPPITNQVAPSGGKGQPKKAERTSRSND
jgi:DnaJ-class molecular chaperone